MEENMGSRTVLILLAVVALVFAGCGSSKKKSATTSYKLTMTGTNEVPKGAPDASASAVVTVKTSDKQLCWKFTNLRNVGAPKMAHIHKGTSDTAGAIVIPLGAAYKPSGCVPGVASSLLDQIKSKPNGFYVNIHNAKYPGGAVRAQL
jgi:hypothetical protein